MMKTPKGLRLHIGIFGRRNVGKSSILNALTRQHVSIVSDTAGTTTDPVEKPMEMLPLGPVLFIDTAGIDDTGALGEERVKRTLQTFERTELGLIVSRADEWGPFERSILEQLRSRNIPIIVIFNKVDLVEPDPSLLVQLENKNIKWVKTVATRGAGIPNVKNAIIGSAPEEFLRLASIAGDLVPPGKFALLVVPIDKEAPKGRLILPQVQTIRDLLDHDSGCIIVREDRVKEAIDLMAEPPAVVITDSQAFAAVARDTPEAIPLTSFSILFARFKGDLAEFTRGAGAIDRLRPGDRVLIAEACTHHPIEDDIGRVKIPRWLTERSGGKLDFIHVQGHDFPESRKELSRCSLIIHCGACVLNRKEMLSRQVKCRKAGVPITNYGIAIACLLGILKRALAPFPDALAVLPERGTGGPEGSLNYE